MADPVTGSPESSDIIGYDWSAAFQPDLSVGFEPCLSSDEGIFTGIYPEFLLKVAAVIPDTAK